MSKLKYSRQVARGGKPQRRPTDPESALLFLVGSGITEVGELIKELADRRQLSRGTAERVLKDAILVGILELIGI